MKKLYFCFFAVFLIIPLSAFGYGYPAAQGLGSPLPGVDAITHGFGGVMSVNVGGMNLFGNPAELAEYNPSFSASIGPLILKQSVDDGLGKHALTYAGLGTSSFQAGLNYGNSSIAIGIAKIRDYTYKGEYFFLDTNPSVIIAGYENLIVDGGVWEAATGFATTLPGEVNLGASVGYRMGTISYDYLWHHFDNDIPDSTSSWARDEAEFAWRAGASVPAGENISIGGTYSSKSENCPSSIALGLRVGNISDFFPGFGFEARIYDTDEKNNAWSANAFGGIHPDHNLYFRGGAVLSSTGEASAKTSLGIFMGTTINLGRTDISAAFNYGSETRNDNVLGFPDVQLIDDIVTGFTVGASIQL